MNFHTVLLRELQIAAKRRGTYWGRAATAAAAILTTLAVAQAAFRGLAPVTMTGRSLLWAIGCLGLAWAVFEGISQTIDSIQRERREGTLGLLFLSNLSAGDIVVGKAGAAGLRAFYGLVATAPAPALTFLLGGVTWPDYVRLMLALTNALFFSLALGMFLSALAVSKGRAAGITAALVLWFAIGAPAAGSALYAKGATVAAMVVGASPTLPLLFLFDNAKGAAAFFTGAIVFSNFVAWLFFAMAAVVLRLTWQRDVVMSVVKEKSAASAGPVALRRSRPLASFWTATILASIGWVVVWTSGVTKGMEVLMGVTLLILHGVLSFEAAALASRKVAEWRASGSLELLLTTPLSEEELVASQTLACKRLLVLPCATLLFLGAVFLMCFGMTQETIPTISALILYAWLAALSFLDLWLAVRGGVWQGLRTGNPSAAMRRTMGAGNFAMLIVPLAVGFGVFLLFLPFAPKEAAMISGLVFGAAAFGGAVLSLFGKSITALTDHVRAAAADDLPGGL